MFLQSVINFKQNLDRIFSVKAKTMILVIVLFLLQSFIFIYFLYKDINELDAIREQKLLSQVENIIQKTLSDTNIFYTNRGYANLNSQGISQAIISKDQNALKNLSFKRWEILQKENPFLKDMRFYDEKLYLIYCFNDELKDIKFTSDFFKFKQKLYYKVSTPLVENGMIKGYIEFILDAKYFLEKISSISNTSAVFSDKFINTKDIIIKLDDKNYIAVAYDKNESRQVVKNMIYSTLFIVFCVLLAIFFVINYGFNVLIKRLEDLNLSLEIRVKDEIKRRMKKEEEYLQNERILMHQSKLALAGEMISSIAHQWKQPLGELSAVFLKIQVLLLKGKLSDNVLQKELDKSENITNFIAKTIDDFRYFFVKDKEKENFSVNFCVKEALKFMSSTISKNDIEIAFTHKDEYFIYGYPREFIQVLLNLLTNAKDILVENKIEHKKIEILVLKEDKRLKIIIIDNGGGIKTEPLEKIFEPYFSTKDKKNGTGIGLYMSKMIIEKKFGGELNAVNLHNGAKFEINI